MQWNLYPLLNSGEGNRQFVNAVDKNLWVYVECKCDGGAEPYEGFMRICITIYLFILSGHGEVNAHWRSQKCLDLETVLER